MVKKEYYLPTASDTRTVEHEVNEILKAHPDAKITLLNPISGIYCEARLEMQCPKCASEVHRTGSTFTCSSCKRAFTQQEFSENSRKRFEVKGTLYAQPILVEEG